MNNQEAKFLLRACRPEGRDAKDPVFAEALEQAKKDPALGAWLEREQKGDALIAEKLASIQPPSGLQETILAGVKASQRQRSWWRSAGWMAAAACVAVTLTVFLRPHAGSTNLHDLARLAMEDSADMSRHEGFPASLQDVHASLASAGIAETAAGIDLEKLRAKHCRTLGVAGLELFEICFMKNGREFHLYVGRAPSLKDSDTEPLLVQKDGLAVAAWTRAQRVYMLVTDAGMNALQQAL